MGAVIQRVVTFPTPRTEYLERDKGKRSIWTDKRNDAKLFEDTPELNGFEKADRRAAELRFLCGGMHVFIHAAVRQKPMPHRPIPEPLGKPPKLDRRRYGELAKEGLTG